jgi:hypothetical protein
VVVFGAGPVVLGAIALIALLRWVIRRARG